MNLKLLNRIKTAPNATIRGKAKSVMPSRRGWIRCGFYFVV